MLSYGLKDLNDKLSYLSISEYNGTEQELLEWVRNHNLVSQEFANSIIIWEESRACLVPKSFYLESAKETYAKSLFDLQDNEMLLTDELEESKLIYPVNQDFYYTLRSKFPQIKHQSLFAKNILFALSSSKLNHGISVFFSDNFIQIVHSEDSKLQFSNSFPFSTDSEAAYFILNFFEQSKLDRQSTPLACIGLKPNSEISTLLAQYLGKLNFHSADLASELNETTHSYPFILSF